MKEIDLILRFHDENYAELEEMAEYLNCSVREVIVKCFLEGFIERNWLEDEVYEKQKIKYARLNLESLIS